MGGGVNARIVRSRESGRGLVVGTDGGRDGPLARDAKVEAPFAGVWGLHCLSLVEARRFFFFAKPPVNE